MPTLWRNGILLGRILETSVLVEGSINGMLEPTSAFTNIEPMTQSRFMGFPNGPTVQHISQRVALGKADLEKPIEPIEIPQEWLEDDVNPHNLPPMSPEEAAGVPTDQLIEIRSDDGTVLDFDMISLICFEIPDEQLAEMREAFGSTDNRKEGWLVHAFSVPQ
jgi:hypothetical protein